jgi:hypothetical protein
MDTSTIRRLAHVLPSLAALLLLAACGGSGNSNPPGDLNFPDLVVAQNPGAPGFYYDYDSNTTEVLVWVYNQGSNIAPSSVVSITFRNGAGAVLGTADSTSPTGALAAGELSGPLRVPVVDPGQCFQPNCSMEIIVDSKDDVVESREDNNTRLDSILG